MCVCGVCVGWCMFVVCVCVLGGVCSVCVCVCVYVWRLLSVAVLVRRLINFYPLPPISLQGSFMCSINYSTINISPPYIV